jgi:hypothetical protein
MKIALACALVIASGTMVSAQSVKVAGSTSGAQSGGPCDCPEDRKPSGGVCGRVAAYCRCGGREPICRPGDEDPQRRNENRKLACGHGCQ